MIRTTAAILLAASIPCLAQTIVAGPIGTNGHRYYIVEAANWTAAQAKAVEMGGSIATIEDATENEFIRANLANAPGGPYKLFIGLNDTAIEGSIVWADGSNAAYRNWANGEPGNDANRDCAYLYPDGGEGGKWMYVQADYTPYAVIELSGPMRVPEEFLTLDAAFLAMAAADTYDLQIGPGIYSVSAYRLTLLPAGRSGLLRGAGAGLTTIAGPVNTDAIGLQGDWIVEDIGFIRQAQHHLLRVANGVVRVRRCSFDGADIMTGAALVRQSSNSSLHIDGCALHSGAGALWSASSDCSATVSSSLFTNLGRVSFCERGYGRFEFDHCTIVDADLDGGYVFEGTGTTFCSVRNSIIWSVGGAMQSPGVSLVVRNSLVPYGFLGKGNFTADPKFVSADDFHLRSDSPCIDAADSSLYVGGNDDLDGNPRSADVFEMANKDERAMDIGCYEVPVDPCPADFNRDGRLNIFDFLAFQTGFGNGCE